MSIRVWNTLTRREKNLEPLEAPRLRLCVCDPPVEDTGASSRRYRQDGAEVRT